MKNIILLIPVLGLALAGCNGAPPDAETQANAASGKRTALGRSVDKAEGIATDSYISQINNSMPRDEQGKPPATLEEARKALKDFPAEMWVDGATGKPLVYDPVTGKVSRAQ